jgi:hypothetical protein
MGAAEVTKFLTSLAVDGQVAASTQHGIGADLVRAGLAIFAEEGLRRDGRPSEKTFSGDASNERMAFGEPRELTQEMQGYSLKLVEYRRSIP